ncbi:hypothetical protein BVC93_15645 [Mycobacterium sp. MS1601]|uniref:hypothetical protein n=1 Tax=Mycobacterium sp. MS1601 TaxID=1936029 RepID=UPI0009796565|nr:hypothetical protein [Mycobacterium sp. MS1601]AQA03607.1 hypothetical protein BVC93_15645 [Mycobacterium sp. MS1601]
MNTVLYFSPNGVAYETRAYTRADISELVADRGLESLTSADRQFDFWFAPTARRCQQRVNHSATEMLLATTRFTAKNVPLLRGAVVIATHDADGELDGLSWQQLDLLANRMHAVSKRDLRALTRRVGQQTSRRRPAPVARSSAVVAPAPRVSARVR